MEVSNIVGLVLSSTALLVSVYLYLLRRKDERYYQSDHLLLNILKINLDYPEFNDPCFTNTIGDTLSKDKRLVQQYDIYAMMIWNFIESMLDYSNRRKFVTSDFYGAIQYWSFLHLNWLCLPRNKGYYSLMPEKHVEYILDIDVGKNKTHLISYLYNKISIPNYISKILDDSNKSIILLSGSNIYVSKSEVRGKCIIIYSKRKKAGLISLIYLYFQLIKYKGLASSATLVSPNFTRLANYLRSLFLLLNISEEKYSIQREDLLKAKPILDIHFGVIPVI